MALDRFVLFGPAGPLFITVGEQRNKSEQCGREKIVDFSLAFLEGLYCRQYQDGNRHFIEINGFNHLDNKEIYRERVIELYFEHKDGPFEKNELVKSVDVITRQVDPACKALADELAKQIAKFFNGVQEEYL